MTAWLFHALLASGALMALVMAVRPWMARHGGAHAAYALWLLPLARLLCPPLAILPMHASAIESPPLPMSHRGLDVGPNIGLCLVAIWAVGAVIVFVVQLWRYRRFMAVASAARARGTRRVKGVEIFRSAAVDGPFAAGLFRRRIVLPVDFRQTYAPAERRFVLTHEATHHRRGDLWINLAALAMLAIHWFNPLAHLAHRLFRIDQEAACDADVLRRHRGQSARYGRVLVKAGGGLPATLCALSNVTMLKERLRRLAHTAPARPLATPLAIALSLIVVMATSAVSRVADPIAAPLIASPARLLADAATPREATAMRAAPVAHRRVHKDNAPVASSPPVADQPTASELAMARGRPVGDPAYLQQRREDGLKRSHMQTLTPLEADASG